MHDDPLSHDSWLANYHPLTHDLLADDLLLHNHRLRDNRLGAVGLGNDLLEYLRLIHDRGRKLHRSGVDRLGCDQRN